MQKKARQKESTQETEQDDKGHDRLGHRKTRSKPIIWLDCVRPVCEIMANLLQGQSVVVSIM